MIVRNVTREAVLVEDLEAATGMVSRFLGLMFRRELAPGAGLLIRPCGSIHMLFMRFPLDAVFFDKEERVTKVARNVRPWRGLAFGGRGSKAVLELAAGAAVGTLPGDQLSFED
ncbi:MAG: DUF192 domain-containing protein [Dehalococcoidia bacterium]